MQQIRYPIIGKQAILPVYVTGIGRTEYEFRVNRERGLASHQFLFTKCGEGCLHIDGRTYALDSGSFFYVAPSVPHEYYPLTDKWTTCWVVFRGRYLAELMSELGFPAYCVCGADTRAFERLFGMILAADDPVSGGERCSMLMYEYILEARRLISGEQPSGVSDGIVGSAVNYIDSRYMQDITLEQLCGMSNVSPQHFCRLFKAQMGMRPLEYIARRRIAQAKLMIQTTDAPIADIGKSIGYPDPTYFGVVFRKYEGISPSEYRKRRNTLAI